LIKGIEKILLKLKTTFQTLPDVFYSETKRYDPEQAELYYYNEALAEALQFNANDPTIAINQLFQQTHMPIAQAYAGHQFGHFTQLGDGRAMLLGEYQGPEQQLIDIHLKGSGQTPFTHRGDGKATLSAMLREVIYSEALAGLHIPTSRSLAILTTGELVQRQIVEPGAILVRLASSHLRVGSFEYAASLEDNKILASLADYSIKRHYPQISMGEDRFHIFLDAVINAQAKLIAKWLQVGFIHGVMNTDNMTISGETLDFGPCAFMNRYNPQTCFSAIDQEGRYAFGNQVNIAKWNLCRFAESLLPLLNNNQDKAIEIAQTLINRFDDYFNDYWHTILCKKLGFSKVHHDIIQHAEQLLQLMHQHQLDYHTTFYNLTYDNLNQQLKPLQHWLEKWHHLQEQLGITSRTAKDIMYQVNPIVIPRNHVVEAAIAQAIDEQDKTLLNKLLSDLQSPYQQATSDINYLSVPAGHDEYYQTYCGT
jgi:uncharacterized protein YdiU (UPF0061 family)